MNGIRFGEKICGNYENATTKEWLLANGRGGYASTTIIGAHTRKYHGVLIAPRRPPWDRRLFLSKVEEEVSLDGEKYQLSTNQYPGAIYPKGYKLQNEFRLDPLPTFVYFLPGVKVRKRIFMPQGRNSVVINYQISKSLEGEGRVRISPLVNVRSIDEVRKVEDMELNIEQQCKIRRVNIYGSGRGTPLLLMGSDLMNYTESDLLDEDRWYRNMEYLREKERGYEYQEDHYNPGCFEFKLSEGDNEFNILATAGEGGEEDFGELYSEDPQDFSILRRGCVEKLEDSRRGSQAYTLLGDHRGRKYLLRSADSFIAEDRFIIAGYPWFSTWGRDTLISLPGLTLVTGEFDIARDILITLGGLEENGLIPNRFGDGWREFNSADSSLLFFYALYKYLTYSDDLAVVEELWETLESVLDSYSEGMEGKVGMSEDGFIWTKGGMTWMDAKVRGQAVTPREGATVEMNSLWYNALKIMNILANKTGRESRWHDEADKFRRRFIDHFWNPRKGCLHDMIGEDFKDGRVRPNQIFAVSLPFPILEGERAENVISVVRDELATPYGLRSLERGDPGYRGNYEGDIENRDLAYHQGTIWSWLLGPYITALNRIDSKAAKKYASKVEETVLTDHLREAGLGMVSEVFDGDEPHSPKGCISQAWSVGEILRSFTEDIKGKRPPFEEKYR